MDLEIFLKDVRTYRIMSLNENYYERLFEAYKEMKSHEINSGKILLHQVTK